MSGEWEFKQKGSLEIPGTPSKCESTRQSFFQSDQPKLSVTDGYSYQIKGGPSPQVEGLPSLDRLVSTNKKITNLPSAQVESIPNGQSKRNLAQIDEKDSPEVEEQQSSDKSLEEEVENSDSDSSISEHSLTDKRSIIRQYSPRPNHWFPCKNAIFCFGSMHNLSSAVDLLDCDLHSGDSKTFNNLKMVFQRRRQFPLKENTRVARKSFKVEKTSLSIFL